MPKRKYKRPAYTSKNHKLDNQMETSKFAELLSANSLLQLKNIMDKQGRKNERISKNYD